MKKRLLLVFLIFFCFKILAEPVDSLQISQLVEGFVSRNFSGKDKLKIESIQPLIIRNNTTYLSVVNLFPKGWILISTDDRAQPVFGYNFDQKFDITSFNQNPGFQFVVENDDNDIEKVLNSSTKSPDSRWSEMTVKKRDASVVPEVLPLIGLSWNQGNGWNTFCPADSNGSGGHVYVGCVAVAMAQAMTVYKYPTRGVGSKSYYDSGYGTQAVNFSTYGNYNWSNIVDGSNSPNEYKAALLYHCAVTVEMSFGVGGSGSYVRNIPSALSTYFNYSKSTKALERVTSDTEWIDILNKELLNGRPVVYGGDANNGLAGHAFNIDGVTSNGFYHLNWGWSESNNGYFSIDNLKPGSYDFTKNQSAVIGIKPVKAGPTNISLSNSTVLEGLSIGSVVGNILVEDEMVGNTYTYTVTGTYNLDDELNPAGFMEENGVIKTKKVFDYVSGRANREGMIITIKDQFNNRLEKTLFVNILENTAAVAAVSAESAQFAFYNYLNKSIDFVQNIEVKDVQVFSLTGVCVLNPGTVTRNIDVSGLAPGAYIAVIKTFFGKVRLKFLKN